MLQMGSRILIWGRDWAHKSRLLMQVWGHHLFLFSKQPYHTTQLPSATTQLAFKARGVPARTLSKFKRAGGASKKITFVGIPDLVAAQRLRGCQMFTRNHQALEE